MAKHRVDAVALPEDDFLNRQPKRIVELMTKQRLPSIGREVFAEAGGLIGYGVNIVDLYRRAAIVCRQDSEGGEARRAPCGATNEV